MAADKLSDFRDEYDDDFYDGDDDDVESMYLTFDLGDEIYGVGIAFVTEIVGVQKITEMPDMPNFVRGVVNLRGQVIPVVDVRLRFKMQEREYDERTCIIVIRIADTQVGLIVDTVNEVMIIEDANISSPPSIATANSARYLKGMAKVGEDVKILLDCEKLLFDDELAAIA